MVVTSFSFSHKVLTLHLTPNHLSLSGPAQHSSTASNSTAIVGTFRAFSDLTIFLDWLTVCPSPFKFAKPSNLQPVKIGSSTANQLPLSPIVVPFGQPPTTVCTSNQTPNRLSTNGLTTDQPTLEEFSRDHFLLFFAFASLLCVPQNRGTVAESFLLPGYSRI